MGLTRQSAKVARAQAADILARLDGILKLPGGPELSAAYKNAKSEVEKSVVSLVDKESMRTKLNAIYDTIKVCYSHSCLLSSGLYCTFELELSHCG